MRKAVVFPVLVAFLLLVGYSVGVAYGDYQDDLKYLGYSEELGKLASEKMTKTHVKVPIAPKQELTSEQKLLEEADSVKEQLAELGKTRALTPDMSDRAGMTKEKIDEYWKNMRTGGIEAKPPLPQEVKDELKQKLSAAIEQAGYELKQLDLIDVPKTSQVRVVVRAVRPLKSKNSYAEIQQNLAELKDISMKVGTVDNVSFLSELTTFVAEDPSNKYYYEKTILNPNP